MFVTFRGKFVKMNNFNEHGTSNLHEPRTARERSRGQIPLLFYFIYNITMSNAFFSSSFFAFIIPAKRGRL